MPGSTRDQINSLELELAPLRGCPNNSQVEIEILASLENAKTLDQDIAQLQKNSVIFF